MRWSVIVCCHNSEQRIAAVVRHLAAAMPADAELLLVDNRCTDRTVPAFLAACAEHRIGQSRVVEEPVPGLMHARRAGVLAAQGELVAFIDDDNLVRPDYFKSAGRVFDTDAAVWVFGCATELPATTSAPGWLEEFKPAYALGRQGSTSGLQPPGCPVWGAGLALRAAPLKKLFESAFCPLLVGRTAGRQLAGDDSELVLAVELLGGKVWYEDRVLLEHAIDPARFSADKLASMHAGFGASSLTMSRYMLAARGAYPENGELRRFLVREACRDAASFLFKTLLRRLFRPGYFLMARMRSAFLVAKWSPAGLDFTRFHAQDQNVSVLRALSLESQRDRHD